MGIIEDIDNFKHMYIGISDRWVVKISCLILADVLNEALLRPLFILILVLQI